MTRGTVRSRRVLVIGAGVAGASAAIAAAEAGAEVLVLAGAPGDAATRHAQGGIAAALGAGDPPAPGSPADLDAHAADTVRAAAGLGDPEAIRVLVHEGAALVRSLIVDGLPVDRDAAGRVSLGLEAAHDRPRIVHSGGDRSGAALAEHLTARMRHLRIEHLAPARLVELVVRDGIVTGAVVTGAVATGAVATGAIVGLGATPATIDADAVVIATGGLGRCYPTTSTPPGARGDGLLAAWEAGAQLADLEFVQFHPTTLPFAGGFLVSEAVRGAGATLLDELGRRFVLEHDDRGELAPRDVVAAAVARTIEQQRGRPVLLDARGIARREGAGALRRRFPTIDAVLREHGIDWTRELVPVAPAAHFSMGGIRTDLHGRSSIPGLLAAGECARTGAHGANRLASNSLLEGLVFGTRAGRVAATGPTADAPTWSAATIDDAPAAAPAASRPRRRSDRGVAAGAPPTDAAAVRAIIGAGMGIERDAAGLSSAIVALEAIAVGAGSDTAPDHEAGAIARIGRLIGTAALRREESRGAHRRRDHPATDPALAHPLGIVRGRRATDPHATAERSPADRSEISCSLTP